VSDAWEEEGFGGEDDWAGDEGLEGDVEDDAPSGSGSDLDDPEAEGAELDEPEDDTLADED
jgi:hypothetical protein